MTPKIVLLVVSAAAALWALHTARHKVSGALATTIIEIVEALFWGYVAYLLVAIPFSLNRLNEWSNFIRLLFFVPPFTGIQDLALLVGILTAILRFLEPFSQEKKSRKADEHKRGKHVEPLPPEPSQEATPGALRKLLQRVLR
jgi:hypothetical protein